jgi:hypothetical protein
MGFIIAVGLIIWAFTISPLVGMLAVIAIILVNMRCF